MKVPQSVVKTLLASAARLRDDIEGWETTQRRQEQQLEISRSTADRLRAELAEAEAFFAGLEQ